MLPLSPHLQVYKPQLTSILSIMHRITGCFLSVGILLLMWWLYALAENQENYHYFQAFWDSFFGQLLKFGFIVSGSFHFYNGIRHLIWDMGFGFDLATVYKTGWTVLALTVLTSFLVFFV